MNLSDIKTIVQLMKRADLTEFEIEEESLKLRIARKADSNETIVMQPQTVAQPAYQASAPQTTTPEPAKPNAENNSENFITSPMVGTFYTAPSPESEPFVKEGDTVSEDTVICIIEAMKVMNEITAEKKGRILKALVKNGDTVEFGQPIFQLED